MRRVLAVVVMIGVLLVPGCSRDRVLTSTCGHQPVVKAEAWHTFADHADVDKQTITTDLDALCERLTPAIQPGLNVKTGDLGRLQTVVYALHYANGGTRIVRFDRLENGNVALTMDGRTSVSDTAVMPGYEPGAAGKVTRADLPS